MYGTFGEVSSRGDRLRVGSFGERSGDGGVDAAGSTRKLSSIEVTRTLSPKFIRRVLPASDRHPFRLGKRSSLKRDDKSNHYSKL